MGFDLSPTTDQPSNFETISFDCIFWVAFNSAKVLFLSTVKD